MRYPFVPMPQRKPLRWPNGKRMALMLTTNLEYWDAVKETNKPYYPGGPGIVGGDLPGNVYDNPNFTWREYGQRVGVWRLFDIFDEFKVPSTCTMNAKMGIERRAVIDAALERGWEIVAHNYVQTELLTDYMFDEAKEREVIRATLQGLPGGLRQARQGLALVFVTLDAQHDRHHRGRRADLHHGPLERRPALSGRNALRQDRWSRSPTRRKSTTSPCSCGRGSRVDDAFKVFKEQFDWLYRESEKSGRFMNIGLHPHVIGQPFRIRALRDFVAYAKQFDDVWFATRQEIAEWYLQNHKSHIG